MPVNPNISSIRVLVISSDSNLQSNLKKLLTEPHKNFEAHYYLDKVDNCKSGLTVLQQIQFDICFLHKDINEERGFDFLKKCTLSGLKIPVIYLSEKEDYHLNMNALREGASEILKMEGLESAKLKSTIKFCMERRFLMDESRNSNIHYSWTGLPNRLLFQNRLRYAMKRAKNDTDSIFAVLMLDVNDFNRINDSYGYSTGDQLLLDMVSRIKETMRPKDVLGHLAGDQFVILLENLEEYQNILVFINRIQNEFKKPFHIYGDSVHISLRIGAVVDSSRYKHPDHILRDSVRAAEQVKSLPGKNFCLYEGEANHKAAEHFNLEMELRSALELGELEVYYQPKINVETGCISGMEALLRWHHPQKGMLFPVDFIPIAEETGIITDLGHFVLKEACQQIAKWEELGYPNLSMAINFSSRQFQDFRMLQKVEECLTEYQIKPGNIEIDIRESAALKNKELCQEVIQELKNLGVKVAMDDFGSGYSSLSSIRMFPVNILKIDKSFVSELESNQDSRAIVSAIISMAKYLSLETVAEGVESESQLKFLKEEGCMYFQGFFHSQPSCVQDINSILEQNFSI